MPQLWEEKTGQVSRFIHGDVLFGKLRPYLAKAFCAEFDGICTTELLVLEPTHYQRRYLLYLLLSDGFISQADQSTYGARMPRTDWEFIGNLYLPVPSTNEQTVIGAYLDRETERIDALVAKQRELIERLDEYSSALITRAVTKGLPPNTAKAAGLDPEPPMKPSGVDWLGTIPNKWGLQRLGFALADSTAGGTPSTDREDYWAETDECGIPWVAIADMSNGRTVERTSKAVTELGISDTRLKILPRQTIIYSMYASIGVVAILGLAAVTNQAILGLQPRDHIAKPWLYWWLQALRGPVASLTRDNTQANLNADTVHRLPILIPAIDEQLAIAAYLDRETARLDELRGKAEQLIERLREYRTALISAAVTGKIDVRDAVDALAEVRD